MPEQTSKAIRVKETAGAIAFVWAAPSGTGDQRIGAAAPSPRSTCLTTGKVFVAIVKSYDSRDPPLVSITSRCCGATCPQKGRAAIRTV